MEFETLDPNGYEKRKARELAPAMLAVIRSDGPISPLAALRKLKAEGRIKPGVTAAVGLTACLQLADAGLIKHGERFEWVPSDRPVIMPGGGRVGEQAALPEQADAAARGAR